MEQESELLRLEKFVEKILTRFSALKAEKAQLEQELAAREQLIEELEQRIEAKDSERSEIGRRVAKIVDQIEEWELSLEPGEEPVPEVDTDQETAEEEVLATADDHVLTEAVPKREQEERRVQHDLFSMAGPKDFR